MNIDTGELKEIKELLDKDETELSNFVPVHREVTQLEKSVGRIGRNSPCVCGSGKKAKKCCLNNKKEQAYLESQITQLKSEIDEIKKNER